jgi:hypothetical protein
MEGEEEGGMVLLSCFRPPFRNSRPLMKSCLPLIVSLLPSPPSLHPSLPLSLYSLPSLPVSTTSYQAVVEVFLSRK